MPSNISRFMSGFKKDLARPNRFDVMIPIPIALSPFYLSTSKNLNMRCEMTEMPGRTFGTTERKIGSSPIERFPYQSIYNDVSMTFIVDGDMKQKLFFDQWMEYINPTSTYNYNYKQNYASDISITQYDMQNKVTYRAVLIDAYPLVLNQLDLDWSNEGYHKLTVTFAYTKWQEATVSSVAAQLGTSSIAGLFGL